MKLTQKTLPTLVLPAGKSRRSSSMKIFLDLDCVFAKARQPQLDLPVQAWAPESARHAWQRDRALTSARS